MGQYVPLAATATDANILIVSFPPKHSSDHICRWNVSDVGAEVLCLGGSLGAGVDGQTRGQPRRHDKGRVGI